ncbi:MAG: NfeD family protein [Eubacteriales bacterium]
MNEWWTSLNSFQQFFYIIAIISTTILVIQTILNILGLDDDIDGTFDADDFGDADFQFFSIRGIIAFFTLFGWTGALLSSTNLHGIIILLAATISGFLGMGIVAYLMRSMSKLQDSGTLNYQNAIGQTGEVYIPISPNREQKGKISLTIQGRLIEADAITDENEMLNTGTVVEVVDKITSSVLVVKKIN